MCVYTSVYISILIDLFIKINARGISNTVPNALIPPLCLFVIIIN